MLDSIYVLQTYVYFTNTYINIVCLYIKKTFFAAKYRQPEWQGTGTSDSWKLSYTKLESCIFRNVKTTSGY